MGCVSSKEYTSNSRLDGQTVIITGGNSGIGFETAADMYLRGGRIIIVCRNKTRGLIAEERILIRYRGVERSGQLKTVLCDLSSLASVRECAKEILESERTIDILINNAGIMMSPYELSKDGYELQFATNHLGHFLLTTLLLPRIISGAKKKPDNEPSRIITVTSWAHYLVSDINLNDINLERHYSPGRGYYRSKAANILFSNYLAKQLQGSNVNCYSVHPGIVLTNIWKDSDNGCLPGTAWFIKNVVGPLMKNASHGTQTILYCALDQECARQTGLFYR